MPLLGKQPQIVKHMKSIVNEWLPRDHPPKAIVVLSAHWDDERTIKISASEKPTMLFDYYGFPPESYEYNYPAPGSPELASRIQHLLMSSQELKSELDYERGLDHGVFIPLMVMYPKADIPVVCISLDGSLSAEINMKIGSALQSLPDEEILILGSGYTFHNLRHFFHPSKASIQTSVDFDNWLKKTILSSPSHESMLMEMQRWEEAPGARDCHPREEHLLPLFMVAAAGGASSTPQLISEQGGAGTEHATSAYIFK